MEEPDKKLAFVGKIVDLEPIPNADFIVSASVVCGQGGKWKGVVLKDLYRIGDKCLVYLPDAVIPESDEMRFMEKSDWRVKMRRFKGAASEVVIVSLVHDFPIGYDLTIEMGVTKYHKPIPVNLQGKVKGFFPGFIPKTDELNYQMHYDLVDQLHGLPYYITEKADGASTTAYRYKGDFGICSRNLELLPDSNNGYWKVAAKFNLENRLPEGYAMQWETCGPKIQGNPMGLKDVEGFAFSIYNITNQKYLEFEEFLRFCKAIQFPTVKLIGWFNNFDKNGLDRIGEGKYSNGHEREGVVIRSRENILGHKPISFKVINLNYEK